MKYVCSNCRYRFESGVQQQGKRVCPYCGEKSAKEQESAEELLNESE